MTVAVGTELGASAGLGAGAASGTGAVRGTGVGAGSGIGAAALERAGTVAPGKTAAFALGEGKSAAWLHATAVSETPAAGEESFKANWQSMLRAWGVAAHTSGEAQDEAAGEAGGTDAAGESNASEGAEGVRASLARVGGSVAQSTPAASGSSGSAASAAASAMGAARANRPQSAMNASSNIHGPVSIAQSAATVSATKTAGGSTGKSPGSKFEKRVSDNPSAGTEGQAVQGANGLAASPVDGVGLAAQAAAQAQAAPENSVDSAAPSLADGVDDRVNDPAMNSNRPAPKAFVAVSGAKGAASTAPASAAVSSSASARAAGQIPIVAAQNPLRDRAMSAGRAAAIGEQDLEEDGEQEEFAALPQASLTAAAMAAGGASGLAGASRPETSSGVEVHKTVEAFGTHSGVHATGGTSAASAAAAADVNKPSAETGTESPQPPPAQATHESASAGASATTQPTGAHVVMAQTSGQTSGMEASAMVRDTASACGTAGSPIAASAGSPAGQAAAPQETFAALDSGTTGAGTAVGTPSWVHAGGRQAEAGFEDPALGWVGVRADLSGGSVHASVVPGSSEAAQALNGHLVGLSAYLSEQHSPVATLTMAAPGNSGMQTGMDQGVNQGMQQNAGQDAEQNSALAPKSGASTSAAASGSSSATPANGHDVIAYAGYERGTHISVMA